MLHRGLNSLFLNQVERLADLEVFQRQKEQLMSEMKTMEKQLVSQEEEHQAAIHKLEIEVLLEKERLDVLSDQCQMWHISQTIEIRMAWKYTLVSHL